MDRCPKIVAKGDAEGNLDICKLDGKVCVLVSGNDCYIWEQIQAEDE